jgi:hypothetical protein
MAGQLSTNPFMKTYDELQRSLKRMETYLDINRSVIPAELVNRIERMAEAMEAAIEEIPYEYHVTKHHYSKK